MSKGKSERIKEKVRDETKIYTTCDVCGLPVGQSKASLTSFIFSEKRCNCPSNSAVEVFHSSSDERASETGEADGQSPIALTDRYEVLSVIGEGGMGTVFKAKDKVSGKIFAIKVLHSHLAKDREAVKRFQLEVKATQQIAHANIATVYDSGLNEDGAPFFVMDYVEGESLADLLNRDKQLPLKRILDIFTQVADALICAHEHKIVHRDLKPANILLTRAADGSDVVKVVDFGIAKILPTPGRETLSLTKTAEIFGSPTYMSPEQCRGERIDHRADIYSLGCVLFEAITGRPPLEGENPVKTLLAHIYDEIPPMRSSDGKRLNAGVEAVLRGCLMKDPAQRYQSIAELRTDLDLLQCDREPKIQKRLNSPESRRKLKTTMAKYSPLVLLVMSFYLIFLAINDVPWMLTTSQIQNMRWTASEDRRGKASELVNLADAYNRPFALMIKSKIDFKEGFEKEGKAEAREAIDALVKSHRYRGALPLYSTLIEDELLGGNLEEARRLADEYLSVQKKAAVAPPEKGIRLIGWFYMPAGKADADNKIADLFSRYGDLETADRISKIEMAFDTSGGIERLDFLFKQGKVEEARTLAKQLISTFAGDDYSYSRDQLAFSCLTNGQTDLAMDIYAKEGIRTGERSDAQQIGKRVCSVLLGKADSVSPIEASISDTWFLLDAASNFGEAFAKTNNYEGVRALYQVAPNVRFKDDLTKTSEEVTNYKSRLLLQEAECLQRVGKADQAKVRRHDVLANLTWNNHEDFYMARKLITESIASGGNDHDFNLAALAKMTEIAKLQNQKNKLNESELDDDVALYGASIANQAGLTRQAIASYRTKMVGEENLRSDQVGIGNLLAAQGDPEAISGYLGALEITGTRTWYDDAQLKVAAALGLSRAYCDKGSFQMAESLLRRAMYFDGRIPFQRRLELYKTYADVLRRNRDSERANVFDRRVMELEKMVSEGRPEANSILYKSADESLREAVETSDTPELKNLRWHR